MKRTEAAMNAVSDVEEVIGQKNWDLDDVVGTEVGEIVE